MAFGEEQGGQQQSPQNLEALVAKILKDEKSRKVQQEQIDKIENNVRVIGNMICKDGVCTLASKEDLARVAEKQGGDISQFSGQQLWDQIKTTPRYEKEIKDIHLQKLKREPDYLKEALEDKELVGKMVSVLCDDQGCRLVFNTAIDQAHKEGKTKGQKDSWLVKKK